MADNSLVDLIRLVFQVLSAVLMFLISFISIAHSRKSGNDVAGLTFGTSFFVMFFSSAIPLVIYFLTGLKNVAGSHVNEYVWWFVALASIPASVGCFTSIFVTGKVSSTIMAPIVLLVGLACGLPFIEKIVPVIPSFQQYGSFVWFISGVFFGATALMYYFYNFKAKDRFRLWMGNGFIFLAISCILSIFSGSTGFFYLSSIVLQFLGLFVIFYEIQFV